MRYLIYVLTISLITSCSISENKRAAFMGLELGSSEREYNKKLTDLVNTKQVRIYKTYSKNIYYCKRNLNFSDYYMAFIYKIPETDSLIESIDILYCNEIDRFYLKNEDIQTHLDRLKNGNTSPSLLAENLYIDYDGKRTLNKNGIKMNFVVASELKDSVIKELNSSYGEFNTKDKIGPSLEINGFTEIYKWKNKNGVDITLKYWDGRGSYMILEDGNACLTLNYSYTKSLHDKIFKRKNSY